MWESIIYNKVIWAFAAFIFCGLVTWYCFWVVKKDRYNVPHWIAGAAYSGLTLAFLVAGILELIR